MYNGITKDEAFAMLNFIEATTETSYFEIPFPLSRTCEYSENAKPILITLNYERIADQMEMFKNNTIYEK